MTIAASLLLVVFLASESALAKQPKIEEIAESLPSGVLRQIKNNADGFRTQAVQRLFSISPDGIATPKAVKLAEQVLLARRRAQLLQQFLTQDLDGDGRVTKEELSTSLATVGASQRATATLFHVEADSDGDGIVTFTEAVRHAETRLTQNPRQAANTWDVMQLDLNGDEKVDATEVTVTIEQIAKLLDQDASIVTSRTQKGSNRSLCRVPKPADSVKAVVLSGYQGGSVSSVAVSGQDRETSVAKITIEPGTERLWIFATALGSIIWKFEGSVERVDRLVIQPQVARKEGPGVGVVGLARERVTFIAARACMHYLTSTENGNARIEMVRMGSRISRPVDHLIAHYDLGEIHVPSGRRTGPEGRGDEDTVIVGGRAFLVSRKGVRPLDAEVPAQKNELDGLARVKADLTRFYPGGVVKIDPNDVVAPGKIEAYQVLPQQAGLVQLMESGALRRTKDGYFVIEKPISRFPGGLNGGHRVKFILSEGVPMPAGDPGHSPVYAETSGECLKGATCR